MNENEMMNIEEYFYRPALGEFAPSPLTGRFNIENRSRPCYDKFGRIFMRNIHVLHVEGIDTESLMNIYSGELDLIRNTPRDPRNPEIYRDFNFLRRSCSTIIRDGLRAIGYKKIVGFAPRDLFVSAARCFLAERKKRSIRARGFITKQLKVEEAPYSALSPFLIPLHAYRVRGIYEDNDTG